jgi:hypothetical protein
MRSFLHPPHGPVVTGLEPAFKVEAGDVRGIRAGEAAGGKADAPGLAPYCFLKLFASIHGWPLHRASDFS